MMMIIVIIIIINLRLAVQIPDSPPQGQMPGVCWGGCKGFELVGANDFQQPIRVKSGKSKIQLKTVSNAAWRVQGGEGEEK